tara:strand:- start:1091 stop:1375 length:285 start_codon:yes stop_codon:yes gene_type:complete
MWGRTNGYVETRSVKERVCTFDAIETEGQISNRVTTDICCEHAMLIIVMPRNALAILFQFATSVEPITQPVSNHDFHPKGALSINCGGAGHGKI